MKHFLSKGNILVLLAAILAVTALGGCTQTLQTLNEVAESVPTPTAVPTVVPVITYSDAMTILLQDAGAVPAGYTAVAADIPNISLFAFTDDTGAVQYRVYGGYTQYIDGAAGETYLGFYPSDETGAILAQKESFSDPASEPFGVCEIQPLPDTIRLRAVYTMLESGMITSVNGLNFVYGSFNGGEGAFYPANNSGAMIPGALPSGERISVPSYTPEEPPTEEGELLIRVYIGTQSIVIYKAVDGEWTEERVMICSTGRSKDMTPRGTFHLVRQYPYKKMGQIKGENVYSQYASRITGSYLFHSVPIGGKSRQNPENGKRQMFVSLYEKLGTFASGGCVRLLCKDAYWMYMNCPVGTTIILSDDNGPTPPEPPALIYEEPYMDAKHEYGWDPTDPDPANPYHAIYPPEFVLDGPVVDKSKD
jgi:hypothetical protein